jgi:hypothetical protein
VRVLSVGVGAVFGWDADLCDEEARGAVVALCADVVLCDAVVLWADVVVLRCFRWCVDVVDV